MEAVVLAGGLGTRLRTVVPDLPKPMAMVAGRPFLEILLRRLAAAGVERVVLSVGYRADVIIGHFGASFAGMTLDYEIESVPLGTGGALRRALARCHADRCLVVNGDTFLDLDITALAQASKRRPGPWIVGLQVPDAARYGRLATEESRLIGFLEKGQSGPGLVNSGHYLLPSDMLKSCSLSDPFSFEADFLQTQLPVGLEVNVFETDALFIDIGIPSDYARAQSLLAHVS